jgi:hypothetical protein
MEDFIKELNDRYSGQPVEASLGAIKAALPDFVVQSLKIGSIVTMDIRMDRVRVWYGLTGNITKIVNG